MSLSIALDFLTDLAAHNEKAWFEANRPRYQQAMNAFEHVVAEVIARLSTTEALAGLTPKECIFRMNRDVRFAKDKSPYKLNFGALIGAQGKRSGLHAYYINLQPNESFIAGGFYDPDKTTLGRLRAAIAADAAPLRAILAAPEFARYFTGLTGETLKTAPAGYDREHPAIDLLRHKQFLAWHKLADAALADEALAEHIVTVCVAMRPFLNYLGTISAS